MAHPEKRAECIVKEITVDLKSVNYIYVSNSCKTYLKKGKFPKLCAKNALEVEENEDPELKLTELENNLIARNIIFQKLHDFQNLDGVELMTD